jgi:BirA family transcriptional regulator, biotin operon repressor / biotin---[acetyl-CoA-carboxylase] ligase
MKLKKFFFKKINSTNDAAIRIIKKSNTQTGIVIAEKQIKGRGQYGKKWTSYKGNLFVSIFFPTSKIKLSLKDLTIINCVLVKKVIAEFYKAEIFIKKPNDLLINRKKISGILQENISKSGKTFIIIGIGINLIKSPKIEGYTTTNLFDLTNIKVNSHNMALKLKKIYEKFIPILPKFNVRNINRI